MTTAPRPVVRPRRDDDVPALVDTLARQQAASGYPHRWPLPFPAREFVVRAAEVAAWCALVDGEPVGHVCVQRVRGAATGPDAEPLAAAWSAGHARPVDELRVVSALFTAEHVRGTGVGGLLLDTAVAWVRAQGLAPCLDVVQGPSPALAIYRHRGWREVARVRPSWLEDDMPPVVAMILP